MTDPAVLVLLSALGAILLFALLTNRADRSETPLPEAPVAPEQPISDVRDAIRLLNLAATSKDVATGTVGGAEVTITFGTPVTMEVLGPSIPAGIALREEANAFLRAFRGEDVTIGDPEFDDAIRVEGGSLVELLALLDAPARRELVRELVRHDFVVRAGKVHWEMGVFTTGDELAAIARAAAGIATRLAYDPSTAAARLALNLLSEPSAAVRVRILQTMASDFPGHPETERAARHSAQDPDVAVRIAGTRLARTPEAVQGLKAVALDAAAGAESRIAALHGLLGHVDASELQTVLLAMLESGSSALAVAALRAARTAGWTPPIERLLAVTDAVHPDARAAAASALDASDPRAEAKLTALLENNERPVVLAAIESLGRAARVGAVLALLPLSQGRLGAADVRKAAAKAIARIQERNPGTSGQLALSEDAAGGGQVSLAPPRGTVAIADKKRS